MRKINKQVSKGQITHITSIMSFLRFSFKTKLFLFFFFLKILMSLYLHFGKLLIIECLGNINCEVLLLNKLGKLHLPQKLLTVTNTLLKVLY